MSNLTKLYEPLPNRCIDCKHIRYDDIKDIKGTHARCSLKIPPKNGKIIYWAADTPGFFGEKELGITRVKLYLEARKHIPQWCPRRNKHESHRSL